MDVSLSRSDSRCPQCLGPAEGLDCGDEARGPIRILRCAHCGDAIGEPSRCPLCDGAADRYAFARSLFAVYVCAAGCLPFAFDATAEEALRRADYDAARAKLRARVRVPATEAPHPLLVTGRIVDDVRRHIEDEIDDVS